MANVAYVADTQYAVEHALEFLPRLFPLSRPRLVVWFRMGDEQSADNARALRRLTLHQDQLSDVCGAGRVPDFEEQEASQIDGGTRQGKRTAGHGGER